MKLLNFCLIAIFIFLVCTNIIHCIDRLSVLKSVRMENCCNETDDIQSESQFYEHSITNGLIALNKVAPCPDIVPEGDTLLKVFLDYETENDTLYIFKNCFAWNRVNYKKDSILYTRISWYIPYDCWLKIHQYLE